MSDHERPDFTAFRQLEQLVRSLGEELASFRRRALQAEARVKAYEAAERPANLFTEQRVLDLEREVGELRVRLRFATERTRVVLDQIRFLRQQHTRSTVNGGVER